jgi:hypothetical protein
LNGDGNGYQETSKFIISFDFFLKDIICVPLVAFSKICSTSSSENKTSFINITVPSDI